jgi:predicted SprT family Zn-dependent metalloprotease
MDKGEFEQYKMLVGNWRDKYCPEISIIYSKRMCASHGRAFKKKKEIRLSLMALAQGTIIESERTMLHEIAHILTPEHYHDDVWLEKYEELCMNEGVPIGQQNPIYATFSLRRDIGYTNLLRER